MLGFLLMLFNFIFVIVVIHFSDKLKPCHRLKLPNFPIFEHLT